MAFDNKIAIRLYRNRGAINVSPTASAYLKLPNCIRLLVDEGLHKMIIQKCEMGERDSFPVLGKNYTRNHRGLKLQSLTFVLQLWEANGWDKSAHYIVPGSIVSNKGDIILFDFTKAEIIKEKW